MELTLREKICQSVIIKAEPEAHIKQFGSIENFMKQYPIGGLFVGGEVCPYNEDKKARDNVIAQYCKYSKIPLLVCMDGENGVNISIDGATQMPGVMAVGAAHSKTLAYDYAAAIAKETAGIGINWTFAPVCDLIINPLNLAVSQRTLGDDVEKASALLPDLIRGYQENGLLCTAKHFPGDGVDYRNQHIAKSENSLSKKEWLAKSGRMFKTAIDAGVDSIMVGHISCPSLQNDAVDGIYPPATLSYDLMTKVLKEEMGFSGVVVSDALDMGGFLRWIYEQDDAEVECFKAGCDMLLWPQLRVVEHILEKVENGEIPMSRVEDAVSRIMKMKEKIKKTEKCEDAHEFAQRTVDTLSKNGTCLIKNSMIPIDAEKIKKIRLVGISTDDKRKELNILKDEFEKHGASVEVYTQWCNYHADFSGVNKDYDLLVFAYMLDNQVPNPIGAPAVTTHTSLIFDRDKTIIASFTSPFILKQFCETAKTYVNGYIDEISLRNFVKGVYGEIEFGGSPAVKVI